MHAPEVRAGFKSPTLIVFNSYAVIRNHSKRVVSQYEFRAGAIPKIPVLVAGFVPRQGGPVFAILARIHFK